MKKKCVGVTYKIVYRLPKTDSSNMATVIWLAKFKRKDGGIFCAKIAESIVPISTGNYEDRCNDQHQLEFGFKGVTFSVWYWRGRMYCKPT